jgi:hypothetical protein
MAPSMSSHLPEQQAASPLQASPAGTQVDPDEAHFPPSQSLLQQSASTEQSAPTIAQLGPSVQAPSTQDRLQQSVARVHGSPVPVQPPVTHTMPLGVSSQRPEQHSADALHSNPTP